MRQLSNRQQILRDLFFLYMNLFDDDLDGKLLDLQDNDNEEDMWNDMFFSDITDVTDLLNAIINTRYLTPRPNPTVRDEYDLGQLFQLPNYTFKQAIRTTKIGFLFLLNEISSHDVFVPRGIRPQLPVAHQLALTDRKSVV